MEMVTFKLVLGLVICWSGISNAQQNNFTAYLNDSIKGYSTWLKENLKDPSAPIQQTVNIASYPTAAIVLNCELRNQSIRGHSVAYVEDVHAESSFTSHNFTVGRELDDPIELSGNFTCFGKIKSEWFPALNNTDLHFYGNGEFSYNLSVSSEHISFLNVGVTENFTLDFEHSYTNFRLRAFVAQGFLHVEWNDTLVSNYLSSIGDEFYHLIERSVDTGMSEEKQQASPFYSLMKEYMDIKTKDLDLRTILSESELPEPYKPEPTTTTTSEPTTEVTEKATTALSTETSTVGSTITESTTAADNASTVFVLHSFVVFILWINLLIMYVL